MIFSTNIPSLHKEEKMFKELSRISGTSLRMIRAYEQKSQDIAKANFGTVSRPESVLHVDFSEIK